METPERFTVARDSVWLHRTCAILAVGFLQATAFAQTPFTWQQIKDKFETTNPTLKATRLNIDESRAAEITAYLRPNPTVTGTLDQMNPFVPGASPTTPNSGYRPFAFALPFAQVSYLHERDHKRELRLEGARLTTDITASTSQDQERGLLFNLRSAFVNALLAKALLQNAKDNLAYWDHELGIFRDRLHAGDIAQIDYDRLELQRVQFESDYETDVVNLRTAKIQLLMLLDERAPLEQFDINGPFDFTERLGPLDDFREVALQSRPDLKAAVQSVQLAESTHRLAVANGSTDPTFSVDFARNPPIPIYFGVSVTIPLRIFDRNQGEKARTAVDIRRNEKLRDAAQAQVFSDVDSAYVTIVSTVNLLRPYREKYLKLAQDTRDRVSFSYQNGGSSLLDYLDAEKAYRDVRLAYLNLIGSYLSAAAQMNMAAGREVL
jgi:outer membrane protein, heavy metal efflux system